MIARLTGRLVDKSPLYVVVDAGGVGYQVFTPLSTFYSLPDLGQSVSLRIHTHLSEQALRLYGFLTPEEQALFESLITISKVGPKLAVTILSGMSPGDLTAAITQNDIARLSSIPGVGRKTAERLAVEMKDKIAKLDIALTPSQMTDEGWIRGDTLSALVNLGYKRSDAEKAVKALAEKHGNALSLEDMIKESLNLLS